jgi:hypothetical protein
MLYGLRELDRLLEQLEERYHLDERMLRTTGLTFHPLLFNLWASSILKLVPCFSGISQSQAKSLFRWIRAGAKAPPFQMPGFKETFLQAFTSPASGSDPEADFISHLGGIRKRIRMGIRGRSGWEIFTVCYLRD